VNFRIEDHVTLLDWLLIAIIAFSIITAIAKGFVYEALMMAATVLGVVVAMLKYPQLSGRMVDLIGSPTLRNFVAFIVILVAALLLAAILGKIGSRIIEAAGLRWFDRLLGGALGAVRGVLICIVLLIVLTAFPINLGAISRSRLAPDFLTAGETLVTLMPGNMRVPFHVGLGRLHELQAGGDHQR
jgi:membrane protein required for colicin V production